MKEFNRTYVNAEGVSVKRCKQCNIVKPLSEFPLNGKTAVGKPRVRFLCRVCYVPITAEYQRIYRSTHQEMIRKHARAYYNQNHDRLVEYNKQRYRENIETIRPREQAYRQQNKVKISETNKRYRETHKDEVKAYLRQYRIDNRERLREHDKHRGKDPKRRAADKDKTFRRYAQKRTTARVERVLRAEIIARDNSMCYLCGRHLESHKITLDHLVPLIRNGEHTATNLRVACRSCNCKKGTQLLSELHPSDFLYFFRAE